MSLELIPLCGVDATLADPHVIGDGPQGLRLIFDILDAQITGERMRGSLVGHSSADWIAIHGSLGTLDVRATMRTDDGALVLIQYLGRVDLSGGMGGTNYVAPLFETGDPRYAWLNTVVAVGNGKVDGNALHYDWYEVR